MLIKNGNGGKAAPNENEFYNVIENVDFSVDDVCICACEW